MRSVSAGDLAHRIQGLLEEKQRLTDSLAQIDETLNQVGAALGHMMKPKKRLGRPPKSARALAAAPPPAKSGRRKRGRRRFAVSGEEAVLAFVKQSKNPTTQEINRHWKNSGRGGTADNTLTKLVKIKQLRREPLEGQRGSSYTVA